MCFLQCSSLKSCMPKNLENNKTLILYQLASSIPITGSSSQSRPPFPPSTCSSLNLNRNSNSNTMLLAAEGFEATFSMVFFCEEKTSRIVCCKLFVVGFKSQNFFDLENFHMPLHMNLGVIRQSSIVKLVSKTWYNVYSHSALLHLSEHNLLELLAQNNLFNF
jgi:hypothetical protein